MATPLFNISNPQEYEQYRNEAGQVHTAGSFIFDNSTGTERVSLTHQSGSTMVFANQATSMFNPNNFQVKTNGDGNDEIEGDRTFFTGKRFENRVGGDFIVVTGTNELYDKESALLNDYVKIQGEIAAAQVTPAQAVGGTTNNTGAVFAREGGSTDPSSGSTSGQTFKTNATYNDITDFIESKTSQLTELERRLGEGGNISLIAGKDLHLQAGTKPVSFDSGFKNPVGLSIRAGFSFPNGTVNGTAIEDTDASAPTYQDVDTYSQMPFGNISFIGNKKITLGAGAGGVDIIGSGSMKFVGTGLTVVGGSQVNITAAGGSTFINTSFLEANANNFNIRAPKTFFDGYVDVSQDVIIKGNLIVGVNTRILGDLIVSGNVQVAGNITCDGTLHVVGNISTDSDISTSGVGSLNSHVHSGVESGGSNTGAPTG